MKLTSLCVAILPLFALAACESSSRFGSYGSPSQPMVQRAPEPMIAAPTPRVESAPLGAPPGTEVSPQPGQIGQAGIGADPLDPNAPLNGEQGTIAPTPGGNSTPTPRVASLPKSEPAAPRAPTRNGVTGNWTLSEASGGRCKATLSSAPALDLYKASTSGCKSREMQRITAWELRGSDIYLYEQGGAVAAKLQQGGGNSFSGATAKSGAPVTLSK
jgi:Protease inhibitor Inh